MATQAQIPIVMGSISDQNPEGIYTKVAANEKRGYQQIFAPDYKPRLHGDGGSTLVVVLIQQKDKIGNNVNTEEQTDSDDKSVSTVNERGKGSQQTDAMARRQEEEVYSTCR